MTKIQVLPSNSVLKLLPDGNSLDSFIAKYDGEAEANRLNKSGGQSFRKHPKSLLGPQTTECAHNRVRPLNLKLKILYII